MNNLLTTSFNTNSSSHSEDTTSTAVSNSLTTVEKEVYDLLLRQVNLNQEYCILFEKNSKEERRTLVKKTETINPEEHNEVTQPKAKADSEIRKGVKDVVSLFVQKIHKKLDLKNKSI